MAILESWLSPVETLFEILTSILMPLLRQNCSMPKKFSTIHHVTAVILNRRVATHKCVARLPQKTMTVSERAQLVSIEVAEIVAMKSKSHTLTESVILPTCKKMVKSILEKLSQEDLKQVLHQVVETVNYIKSRPIKSRLFEELCKSMDSQHVRLLMHTDVRWLSKDKV
ncbi:hypothetical protein FHG87_003464 [Trinorchestia longiramus]|nr:hypothetical protein FHG87_003464 [Trinorchestia longiramus]